MALQSMAVREALHKLLTAFESGSSTVAVTSYLNALAESTRLSLTAAVVSPPPGISPDRVLRALWLWVHLRPTILCKLATASLGPEASVLVEAELLVIGYARSASKPPSERLRSVSSCASALAASAARSTTPTHMTLLLVCGRAAEQVGTERARAVCLRIFRLVIRFLHAPAYQTIAPFVALLEGDCHLPPHDNEKLLHALDIFVSVRCARTQLPVLIRTLLPALGRATSPRVIAVLGRIAVKALSIAHGDVLSDMLAVLTSVVVEASQIRSCLVSAIYAVVNRGTGLDGFNCTNVLLGVPHIAVLFHLLGNSTSERAWEDTSSLLKQILLDEEVPFDSTNVASSSTANPHAYRKFAIINAVKVPAVAAQGEAIAAFLEGLMWERHDGARKWGSELLFEVFVRVPSSRKKVLNGIATVIVNAKVPEFVLHAFCGLLEHICTASASALLLREYGSRLEDMLKFVEHIPVQVDNRVVCAILRFSMNVPHLKSQMLVFLQKVTGSRSWRLQRLACAGFLSVMAHGSLSLEERSEACSTIGRLIEMASSPVRSYLVLLLIEFIRGNPILSDNFQAVTEFILKRLELLHGKDASAQDQDQEVGSQFTLSNSFHKVDQEFTEKDDYCTLLRFCVVLQNRNEQCRLFLRRAVIYFGDPMRVLEEACRTGASHPPARPRFKQLCTFYQTFYCLAIEGLSSAHMFSYSICLIIHEFLESRASGKRYGSSTGVGKSPRRTKETLHDELVTACEATTTGQYGVVDVYGHNRYPLRNYLNVLESLQGDQMDELCKGAVGREFLQCILVLFRTSLRKLKEDDEYLTDKSRLLEIAKNWFEGTCPWNRNDISDNTRDRREGSESHRAPLSDKVSLRNKDAKLAENVRAPSGPEEKKMTLSTITLPNADAQMALGSTNIARLKQSLPLELRQLSLQVVLELLRENDEDDHCLLIYNFIKAVTKDSKKAVIQTRSVRRKQSMAQEAKQETQQKAQSASPMAAVLALTEVLCLEFEHGLSISLTLLYLRMLQHLLKACRIAGHGDDVGEVVSSTVLKLLREYSVHHKHVLRSMLDLLWGSFDVIGGLKFCSNVLLWLGNDACLLNASQAAGAERADTRIGVGDFDDDILQEAIDFDCLEEPMRKKGVCSTDYEQETPSAPGSSSTESANACIDGNLLTCVATACSDRSDQRDAVRSLCLNENEDNGQLSLISVLDYLQSVLKEPVEAYRRGGGRIVSHMPHTGVIVSGVSDALENLFGTPFAAMNSPRNFKIPERVRRKIANLLLALLEIIEIHVGSIMKSSQQPETCLGPSDRSLLAITKALRLLVREQAPSYLLASLGDWDYSSRSAFLQEKLDSTATAFLLSSKSNGSKEVQEFRALLQERIRKREAQRAKSKHAEADADILPITSSLSARPSKRQRLRSRNRYVDECLQEQERGDDNFADLEQFIVPMEAEDL